MILVSSILSSLFGAGFALIGNVIFSEWKRSRRYRALVDGIIKECEYDDSILQEIRDGSIFSASFKRASVEYFRYARESAVADAMKPELVSLLSRVCVDLDLFNREADIIQKSYMESKGPEPGADATKISIAHAAKGVRDSLIALKNEAEKECRNSHSFPVFQTVISLALVLLFLGQMWCVLHCCRNTMNSLRQTQSALHLTNLVEKECNHYKTTSPTNDPLSRIAE